MRTDPGTSAVTSLSPTLEHQPVSGASLLLQPVQATETLQAAYSFATFDAALQQGLTQVLQQTDCLLHALLGDVYVTVSPTSSGRAKIVALIPT